MRWSKIFLLLFVLIRVSCLQAQDIDKTKSALDKASENLSYFEKSNSDEKLDDRQFDKLQNNPNSKKGGDLPPEEFSFNIESNQEKNDSVLFKWLLIIICAILLTVVVFGIIKHLSNKKSSKPEYKIKDKESEEFAKKNLQSELDVLLQKGDYRMACRYLYLQLLQKMVIRGFVLWRNEKTNWQYYDEALSHKSMDKAAMFEITNEFDFLWYGNKPLTLSDYDEFKRKVNIVTVRISG